MPVFLMKLDMNMAYACFAGRKARFVVQFAISMAHKRQLCVVAEGIETKEQPDKMTSIDVDYIQGYVFSKPLPVGEYLEFITNAAKV